jgi:hypothetical protein
LLLQIDEVETKFLWTNSTWEFSHSQDPKRTLAAARRLSAPPRPLVKSCLDEQNRLSWLNRCFVINEKAHDLAAGVGMNLGE